MKTSDTESVFELYCPHCGHKIFFSREQVGIKTQCKECCQVVTVPEPVSTVTNVAEVVTKVVVKTGNDIAKGVHKGTGEGGCGSLILSILLILGLWWIVITFLGC